MFAGSCSVGGTTVNGVTVTVKVADELMPSLFVAVHVTVVVATANVDPDAGRHDTGSVPSLKSDAVGSVNVTTAPELLVAAVVISAGTPEIVGAVSITVTMNDPDAVPPSESIAVQLTVVTPIGNVDADAGVHTNDDNVVPAAGVAFAV
jgi:hypothetical protein